MTVRRSRPPARRTGRRYASVAVAVLLATSAACGSGEDTSDGKITLTIGTYGQFGYDTAQLYAKYEQLNPNIKIRQLNVKNSSDYYKQLQTHLAANSGLADIQGIEIGFVADLAKNQQNKFVNFAELPDSTELKNQFFGWKWQQASSADGSFTIGLGTDAGPQTICYRKDLFQAAGLPTDREELGKAWTDWNAFIAMGRRYVQSPSKKPGTAFVDTATSVFQSVLGQYPTSYTDTTGNLIYASNPAIKHAWDYSIQVAEADLSAKIPQFSVPWNQAFASSSFATVACPAWMLQYISSQAGDAGKGLWDVAPMPGGSSNWGGSWLGVPTASKHRDEAVALVRWLTAPEQQVTMWTAVGNYPSNSVAAADPEVVNATSDYFTNAPIGELYSAAAAKITPQPVGVHDDAIRVAFTDAISSVESQGKSADAAWDAALSNAKQAAGG
jgi:cellobiose transport system substrate-binding protein